jgi:hypothetical protein
MHASKHHVILALRDVTGKFGFKQQNFIHVYRVNNHKARSSDLIFSIPVKKVAFSKQVSLLATFICLLKASAKLT